MRVEERARQAAVTMRESVRDADPWETLPRVRRRAARPRRVATVGAVAGVAAAAALLLLPLPAPLVDIGPEPAGPPASSVYLERVDDAALAAPGWQSMAAVAHLDGRTVAVGADEDRGAVWVSDDGARSWSRVTIGDVGGLNDVSTAADGGFVAVGDGTLLTSPDGRSWSRVDLEPTLAGDETSAQLLATAAGPGGAVAVGATHRLLGEEEVRRLGAVWVRDPEGAGWSRADLPLGEADVDSGLVGVAPTTHGLYVAGTVSGRPAVWRSERGDVWEPLDIDGLPQGAQLFGLTGHLDLLLAYGADGAGDAAIWLSEDGRSWRPAADPDGALGGRGEQTVLGLAATESGFVAVGADGDRAAAWAATRTADHWVRMDGDLGGEGMLIARGAADAGEYLVVVGEHAPDAAVWAARLRPGPPEPTEEPPEDDRTLNEVGRPVPPSLIAYVLRDGDPAAGIFRIATRDGALELLVAEEQTGQGATIQTLSPDGSTLYLSRVVTSCLDEVVAVDLSDGAVTMVAAGTHPAVSHDGRRLAYAVEGGPCEDEARIVVHDLETGDERVWSERADAELPVTPASLSWGPDDAALAFEVAYEDGVEVRVLDTREPGGSLRDARVLEPDDARAMWQRPTFRGAGGELLVVETCCDLTADTVRLLTVDPDTGRVLGEIAELPALPATVRTDTTGDYVLITLPRGHDPQLWWAGPDGDLTPVLVDGSVTAAIW